MQLNIISTFENCIASVQLKLSDYLAKVPNIKEGITFRLSENRIRNINNPVELLFHIGNRFEILYPHCPECGSSKVIKQEYYPRNLKLAEFGHQRVYVRRYYCKVCEKKFSTPIDVIVEKGHQYARIYQNHIRESYKTGYNSFRHLKKIIHSFYNDSPSHQTIYNWIYETNSKSEAIEPNLSGYYCYDEQYLKIDGKRFYRINLIDSILNKPVRESIVNDFEYDTVKSFIEKAISGIQVHAITTDHRREYKSIMDELKINHQLCIFHLFKMIGKKIFPKLRSKFISNTNKIRLCIIFTEIKEIFRTFDLNIAINRLNILLEKSNEVPRVLNKFISKIKDDFERLTLFMRDGFVSRTTNPIENYYRTTLPDYLKRIFKTPHGALKFLDIRKNYWLDNISKNI
jgi:transposase-like protein